MTIIPARMSAASSLRGDLTVIEAPPPPFSPLALPGLIGWFNPGDPSTVTADVAGKVSALANLAPAGIQWPLTQASATDQPSTTPRTLYGRPALYYVNQSLSNAAERQWLGTATIGVAFQSDVGPGGNGCTQWLIFGGDTAASLGTYWQGWATWNSALVGGVWDTLPNVLVSNWRGDSPAVSDLRQNGAIVASGVVQRLGYWQPDAVLGALGTWQGHAIPVNGLIGELVICEPVLTDLADIEALEAYLARLP